MSRPRSPYNRITNLSIEAKIYDEFRAAIMGREVRDSITRLVLTFLSLPPDAREVLLGEFSDKTHDLVLKSLLRKRRKAR